MTAQPRFHTPRNPAHRTLGGKAAKVAAILGTPLMPWQRMAADVALEVDDKGMFVYKNIVISVPRQAGKTTMTQALGIHRLLTTRDGKLWYTAQTGQAARERFIKDLAPRVMRGLPGLVELKRGAGDTRMTFKPLNSQYRPHPPNDEYLHGEQSDLNQIDEPWAYTETQGDALMQAVTPTQNTKPNAQTMFLSTMGDADSTWWHSLVDAARAGEMERTAIFDWGLPEAESASDLEAVIAAHPAVGHTIPRQAIIDAAGTMKPHEFARAYANQRTQTRVAVFTAEELEAVLTDRLEIDPSSQVAFGAAVSWDRSRAVIAAAGHAADGTPVCEIVDARPGTSWLHEVIPALIDRHNPLAFLVDPRSPASTIANDPAMVDLLRLPTSQQIAAGTAAMIDHIHHGTMRIRPDQEVSTSFDNLVLKTVGELGSFLDRKTSAGSIAAVEAVMLALTGITQAPPPDAPPMIWV